MKAPIIVNLRIFPPDKNTIDQSIFNLITIHKAQKIEKYNPCDTITSMEKSQINIKELLGYCLHRAGLTNTQEE
jgi:hypothetical protein